MKSLVIIGSGGHAKVVVSTARALGIEVLAALDDDKTRQGQQVLGVPITGPSHDFANYPDCRFVLAFGSNPGRKNVSAGLDLDWATLVHPRATVCPTARLGEGTVVFAGAVVQAEASIGRHCILNTGCSVDHDSVLGDFVHIGPGARLCGGVQVGEGSLVGVGACARPGAKIGQWCTVGAGAAVVTDLADNGTYGGVPATLLA